DGHALDNNTVTVAKRAVDGNEMTVTFGREVYSNANYAVDRSKTPIAIDIYNTQGANAGKVQYGIYELNGNTLKMCIAAAGQDRPSDFTSARGDGRTFVVWARRAPEWRLCLENNSGDCAAPSPGRAFSPFRVEGYQTFGVKLSERNMQRPLFRSDLTQAV